MRRLLATLLAAMLIGFVPVAQAEAKSYKTCAELRNVYKHGVSLSKQSFNKGKGPVFAPTVNPTAFKANQKLDLDRDGIACEVVRPKSQNPAPTTSSPSPMTGDIAYQAPSIPGDLVEKCQIREASNSRGMTGAGFPEWDSMTSRSGVVKWALIPIDFQDLKGQPDYRSRVDAQMKLLSEWFDVVSGGKFKVEWVVADKWSTLPGNQADYSIARSDNVDRAPNGPKLFTDAMDAADPNFDFTDIQTVNFILPVGQSFLIETSQGFPWDQVVRDYRSDEGRIFSYSIPGKFFDDPVSQYWSYWAHEFGHAIGLPHVGSSRGSLPPFNPWDLMGGQDGPSRELSGWLRFFAGWLNDDQIYCANPIQLDKVTLTLVPLSDQKPGLKVAIFPLTPTKALIIESRRETKFSCTFTPARNGVLAYVYDATLGHGENFLIAQYPAGRTKQFSSFCRVEPNPDFLLREGDKIVVDGYTIEVLKNANLDRISITKG